MVSTPGGLAALLACLILAQDAPQAPLSRLDPQTRAKLLAAFAGLVILGLGMIALVWLGARVTRRYMNQGGSFRDHTPDDDDWARKPLVPIERPQRPPDSDSPHHPS